MRTITEIIVHCSATPEGRDYTVAQIRQWHLQRGFRDIGYHYVIYRDGTIHTGRPVAQAGAHCTGHNAHSIGVCYIGGTLHGHREFANKACPSFDVAEYQWLFQVNP